MTRLLVVRHGESTWNAAGRWQGWADPPLSAAGESQARAAARRLAGFGGGIVASDLLRARRTAELIAEALGLRVEAVDPGLREIDVGAWTGLTAAELEARFPGQREAWREGRLERPGGGEPVEAFRARVCEALRRLAAANGRGELLVVTHSGVLRSLERLAGLDDPPRVGFLEGRWLTMEREGPVMHGGRVRLV